MAGRHARRPMMARLGHWAHRPALEAEPWRAEAAPRERCAGDQPKHRTAVVAGTGSKTAPAARKTVPQRRSGRRLQRMDPDPHYAKAAAELASALAILEEEAHAVPRPVHAAVAGRETSASTDALLGCGRAERRRAAYRRCGRAPDWRRSRTSLVRQRSGLCPNPFRASEAGCRKPAASLIGESAGGAERRVPNRASCVGQMRRRSAGLASARSSRDSRRTKASTTRGLLGATGRAHARPASTQAGLVAGFQLAKSAASFNRPFRSAASAELLPHPEDWRTACAPCSKAAKALDAWIRKEASEERRGQTAMDGAHRDCKVGGWPRQAGCCRAACRETSASRPSTAASRLQARDVRSGPRPSGQRLWRWRAPRRIPARTQVRPSPGTELGPRSG